MNAHDACNWSAFAPVQIVIIGGSTALADTDGASAIDAISTAPTAADTCDIMLVAESL